MGDLEADRLLALAEEEARKAQRLPVAVERHDRYADRIVGGKTRKRVIDVPGGGERGISDGRAIGSREYDHYILQTRTGYEFNTTPWSKISLEELQAKIDFKVEQLNKDIVVVHAPGTEVKQVRWYMTEALPTDGARGTIAAPLRDALEAAKNAYPDKIFVEVVK
jgi:hypothetical protein